MVTLESPFKFLTSRAVEAWLDRKLLLPRRRWRLWCPSSERKIASVWSLIRHKPKWKYLYATWRVKTRHVNGRFLDGFNVSSSLLQVRAVLRLFSSLLACLFFAALSLHVNSVLHLFWLDFQLQLRNNLVVVDELPCQLRTVRSV